MSFNNKIIKMIKFAIFLLLVVLSSSVCSTVQKINNSGFDCVFGYRFLDPNST